MQCTREQSHHPHVPTNSGVCEDMCNMNVKNGSPCPANSGHVCSLCSTEVRRTHSRQLHLCHMWSPVPHRQAGAPPTSDPLKRWNPLKHGYGQSRARVLMITHAWGALNNEAVNRAGNCSFKPSGMCGTICKVSICRPPSPPQHTHTLTTPVRL